jgi:hypothetical protein
MGTRTRALAATVGALACLQLHPPATSAGVPGIKTRLWSPCSGSMYCWASDRLNPTWAVWYPDAVAQMWPVNSGVAASSRAASLYGNLNQAWPNWTTTGDNPDGHPVGDPVLHRSAQGRQGTGRRLPERLGDQLSRTRARSPRSL